MFKKMLSLTLAAILALSGAAGAGSAGAAYGSAKAGPAPSLENIIASRNNAAIELTEKGQRLESKGSKKLSSDLLRLTQTEDSLPGSRDQNEIKTNLKNINAYLASGEAVSKGLKATQDELVYVYIYLNENADRHQVDQALHTMKNYDSESNTIAAWVPLDRLNLLASSDAVKSIQTVLPPEVRSGTVTSEGDNLMSAAQFRFATGVDGSGIKIGIISDGVDHWTQALSTGNLPENLVVLSNSIGGDEGTAMLEIVHDLAPKAELYFHDCGDNTLAFNAAVSALIDAGCDIICDDIGWIGEPYFEDGVIATHIKNELLANDILYFSSAGNSAEAHYQGQFKNDGYNFHNFSTLPGVNGLPIVVPAYQTLRVVLQWNDRFGMSGNDYDLLLSDASYNPIASSSNYQVGYNDPLEYIVWYNSTGYDVNMVLDIYSYGAASKTMELYVYGGWIQNFGTTSDSIFGHPAVPEVIAVGSMNASSPNLLAPYSSRGNVTISYPTSQLRKKPDLTAIDGVSVTGAGGFPSTFYGTSAAAPHAAAVAALVWSQSRDQSALQIKSMLLNGTYDLGSAGIDTLYGYGRLDAVLAGVPAVPSGLSVFASETSARLTWSANTEIDLSSYQIEYKAADSSLWSTASAAKTSTSYEVSGLTNGKTYAFRLKAKDTQGNWSSYTDTVLCTLVDAFAPPVPAGLKVSHVGDQQLTLTWNAVSAADLAGYIIEYQAVGAQDWIRLPQTGKVTSIVVQGLENGTTYSFRISASDLSGNSSAFSSIVEDTPLDQQAPAIPTGLTAVQGTNRDIALSWNANAEADFHSFELVYQKYGTSTWIPIPLVEGDTATILENLIHNVRYGFKLRARDQAGNWSNYSAVLYATAKDLTAPAMPFIKTAEGRDKSIFVAWDMNPELDLSAYQLEYKATSASAWTLKALTKTTTSFTILSRINGTEYQLRLKAKDTAGNWSVYSETAAVIPRDTVAPPTPSGLKITSVNDKQATLGWTSVSVSDLAGYLIEYQRVEDNVWTEAGTTGKVNVYTLSGLENEVSYNFRIRSFDTSGNYSAHSASVAGMPEDKLPPSVPTGLIAVPGTDRNFDLSWNPNMETDFAAYELVYQKYGTSTWTQIPLTEGQTTAHAANLIHNTKYNFKLRAMDKKGNWSAYSGITYGIAKDFIPPAAPTLLTIEPKDRGLLVSWQANLEADLSAYQLEYKTAAAASWTVKAQTKTATAYSLAYLINGTEYQIRMKAKDTAGNWSDYSDVSTAIPRDQIAPPVPAGLKVSSVNDRQVALSWMKVSATDLLGFQIEYQREGDLDWTSAGITGKVTAYTVPGLENEVSYSFRLCALDTSGNTSGYSAAAQGTPTDKMAPAVPTGLTVVQGTDRDLTVSWNANTEPDFDIYNLVYQKYGTSTWISVPIQAGMTSATLDNLTHNVRYNFKIQARDHNNNWSAYSGVTYATAKDLVPPEQPALSAVTPGNKSLIVDWVPNKEADLYGYLLEYKTVSSTYWRTKTISKTAMTYTLNYLYNGTEYQIRMKAKDAAGNWSAYSEIMSGIPIMPLIN